MVLSPGQNKAYNMSRVIALFDMRLHNPRNTDELEALDIANLWADIRSRIQGIEDPQARTGGLSNPNIPIMIDGGGANLYGYLR